MFHKGFKVTKPPGFVRFLLLFSQKIKTHQPLSVMLTIIYTSYIKMQSVKTNRLDLMKYLNEI